MPHPVPKCMGSGYRVHRAHAQQAIVQASGVAAPLRTTPHGFEMQRLSSSEQFAADIFHVPLFG